MSDEHNEQQQQLVVDARIVTLKIQLPETSENLEIPCSIDDFLFDIVETLKVLPSTREFTSYELTSAANTKLSNETLISELVKENEDSVLIKLIPLAYNEVSARKHVIAVREYANLESKSDSFNDVLGVGYGQSTYSELELTDKEIEEKKETEKKEEESTPISDAEKSEISSLVADILTLKPDLDIVSAKKTLKPLPAVKSLFISQWSPANISRKLAGDLFYLQIQTLESEIFQITAHVSGFFVNNSSNSHFDGSIHKPRNGKQLFNYSLISLLKTLSPLFEAQLKKNDELLSKFAFETYIVPDSTNIRSPWFVKELENPTADLGKSQYNLLHGGIDGLDLKVDWNKDYQSLKGLSKSNLPERISRDQSLISKSSDFTIASIKGALSIIRGEIEPVNPDENPDYFVYLRNGIFYSKAIDSIGQFKSTGGIEAARSCAGKDVTALKYLNQYDINNVHSLLTTVVDYLGHRVICQAPVPGIFSDDDVAPQENEEEESLEQTVKYGFIDDHSDVVSDESFVETFKNVGEAFHLKPHKIWNNDGSKVVDVVTSGYTKGTKGTDGKSYIIDMFRSTPLDIEFIDENYDSSKEDSYPHRETLLRHEAISEWIKRETAVAVKKETERLEKEGKIDSESKPTIGVDNALFLLNPDAFSLTPAPSKELADELKKDEEKVREVSKFVSQILVPEFVKEMELSEVYNAIDGAHLSEVLHSVGINMRYLGKIATLALERKEGYLKQREEGYAEIAALNKEIEEQEEKEIAEKKAKLEEKIKLRNEAIEKGEQVPDFSKELEEEKAAEEAREKEEADLPTKINTIPTPALLDSLYTISVTEMIARATKHFLRKQLGSVPLPLASHVISHVHNCLLSSKANPTPEAPKVDALLASVYKNTDLSILEKDSKYVIDSITKEVFIRFRFNLPENWVDLIRPIQLLKSIALKFGIQWKKRDYAFTREQLDAQIEEQKSHAESANGSAREEKYGKKKGRKSSPSPKEDAVEVSVSSTTFTPEDIVCIAPLVKESILESSVIADTWEAGMLKLSSGETEQLQEGSLYANQAIQFAERIYGSVHNITASYNSKLGSLYASSNDYVDAIAFLKRSFQVFERCSGVDSYQASLALNQLANVYVSNGQLINSVKIYKRLINYWVLASNKYHPNVVGILTSLAVLLMRLQMTSEAIKVFVQATELCNESYGEVNQQSAFFRYQLSQLYFTEKKYDDAIEQSKKAFEIYKSTLGLKDRTTIESRKLYNGLRGYAAHLKTQAKNLQEQEQEARKLEQEHHIKAKQAQKARQVTPNPELANKSIDDIVAFISGSDSDGKKKKKNNKKKNSKK